MRAHQFINKASKQRLDPKYVAENVAGDVNSKERYHFLYPHVPLDMHKDHEYNNLSDRDLQAVKSHQRELAYKLGKPGAEEQSDIASHIQINRARSQYDQEQSHRRKVLDAEKIKRQARDAKRQKDVEEGISDVKNIDTGELAGSTLGGIAGYMAGDALGGPMVGFGAAGVGSAVGGALAKEELEQGVAEGAQGTSVKAWAAQVRNEHGGDVKFSNDKHGGGTVDRAIARNARGEIVGVYNRNTGSATVFEPKQDVEEGWKSTLAGAALSGAMALGAGGAHARVEPGSDPGINRLTGKPIATQQVATPDKQTVNAPKGYSTEYLQKAANPNRTGVFMISIEKAQELLDQLKETRFPKKKGMAESLTLDEQFDIIEEMVEQVAAEHGIDPEILWEEFDSVDDHELFESAAWRRKEGKNKKGGLNAKGVASYRRENPGSKLQTAVTTKPSKLKPGSKAAKRRKSFCARMGGMKGPMKKDGKPTRKALALRKWNC